MTKRIVFSLVFSLYPCFHSSNPKEIYLFERLRNSRRKVIENIKKIGLEADLKDLEDRVIVNLYFNQGLTYSNISKVLGISESSVSRRIRRIFKRLNDRRLFIDVMKKKQLSIKQSYIARDYFITGHSIRDIAQKYRMTRYEAHITIIKIRNIAEAKRDLKVENLHNK